MHARATNIEIQTVVNIRNLVYTVDFKVLFSMEFLRKMVYMTFAKIDISPKMTIDMNRECARFACSNIQCQEMFIVEYKK